MSGEDFSWWYEIMKYIREAPGRVYADELAKRIGSSGSKTNESIKPDEVVNHLNAQKPEGLRHNHFLRQDTLTKGIFSIPSQRSELDKSIQDKYKDYIYNSYLYTPNAPPEKKEIRGWKELHDSEFLCIDNEGVLHIDLTKLSADVRNFKLQSVVDMCEKNGDHIKAIGKINADRVVFKGKTEFSFRSNYEDSPPLKRGLCLRGATFCDDVEIKNVTFDLSGEGQMEAGYNTSKVDLRDVRFFGNVTFRDIRFMGDSPNMELSFEDARICHKNKGSDNKIEFNNVDFGNTHLNFFQMILGEFVYGLPEKSSSEQGQAGQESDSQGKNIIRFNNVLFGDGAKIDFTDAEIDNGLIEISNISALPLSYFCFAPKVALCYIEKKEEYNSPCNYLSFSNCEIQKSLHIRNVSELSFKNTQNYGKIVAADGWGKIAGCEKLKSAGVYGSTVTNKLLQAVYGCKREFIRCVEHARHKAKAANEKAQASRVNNRKTQDEEARAWEATACLWEKAEHAWKKMNEFCKIVVDTKAPPDRAWISLGCEWEEIALAWEDVIRAWKKVRNQEKNATTCNIKQGDFSGSADPSIKKTCCDKARSFVMLKENFAAMGMYDDEDIAFILYMEYKTYLDKESGAKTCCIKKCCYWFLNLVGGYGTAPFRILASLLTVILVSALIYWGCANNSTSMAVLSLGKTLTNSALGERNVLVALLYSLGNVIPFVSAFEPIGKIVCAVTVLENAIGTFLVGYFSVAVVRKTLR